MSPRNQKRSDDRRRAWDGALVLLTMISLTLAPSPWLCGQDYPKVAPYPAIRWAPEVQIDGRWYFLRSIDDVPVQEIVEFARRQYEGSWEKRISEDLVQVLSEMGQAPGNTVKLVLRDSESGVVKTFDKVPLTWENRRAIMEFKRKLSFADRKPETLRRALDEFQAAIDDRWSYRYANQADFDSGVNALRKKIDDGISANEFGIELQKILALGVDGHSEVSGYILPSEGYLPFLVEPVEDRFVAFKSDRSGFLADGFPYLTKIDGRDMVDWCEAASVLVPKGSPQHIRRQCLRHLRNVDYVRALMGLAARDRVEIELTDADGTARKTLTMRVASRPPVYGEWPQSRSHMLDGNIGYLRLPDMRAATSLPEIKKWMPHFRYTAGLIVDVRDNGGGDRDALLQLYSFLAAPDDSPRVVTAAAYRLHEQHPEDHLAQRFMYRAGSTQWTADERRAIADFAKRFQPTWKLPAGQFSDWHYMVLSRLDDPSVFHYASPVVVLMNAKCFSAADVFLAGLKGTRNVTLIGTPSGGGSALSQTVALTGTPLRVRIGSIASFQTNGTTFDGNGVQPDVVVHPVPEYYIGGYDNVLAEAIKRIND